MARSYEIKFDSETDTYLLIWEGHGYYSADTSDLPTGVTNGSVVRGAIKAGSRAINARYADVWDGERDAAEAKRDFRELPLIGRAIVVSTFSPWFAEKFGGDHKAYYDSLYR